jgi:hypothetical protein
MDTANFSQQLRVLPTLVKTLAEDHTHKFKLSAAGHLSVLRGARWSTAKAPLDAEAVQSLAAEIAAHAERAVLGPWFLCTLRGAVGLTIFGERRIGLPAEPIASEVREELLQLTRAGSTGLIAGGIGSNKASMLLWLASQLGRRELVFVSDVPPSELSAPTATHVFPPANDRERRDLERLLRAHDCIFWDRISRGDDLVSFTSTPNTHNRWFSIDADSAETLASRFRSVASTAGKLRLDSCMFIEVNAEAESRIASLCRHEDGGWTELLSTGPVLTKVLGGLADLLSTPKPAPAPRTKTSSARKRRPSPQAGIISPKRVGASRSKPKISGADTPPDEPTVNSDIQPLSPEEFDDVSEGSVAGSRMTSSQASHPDGLEGMSVAELKESAEIDEEELLRQSGEIDLQAFVAARNARRRALEEEAKTHENARDSDFDTPPPGLGLEQSSEHAATNIADGAKVDAMLAEMSQNKADDNAPQFPDVNHDELTPPVRDETTALTAIDMDRIRESSDDDLSWLLQSDDHDDSDGGDDTQMLSERQLSRELDEHNTKPATPIWDADPAPTDELSEANAHEDRGQRSEPEDS